MNFFDDLVPQKPGGNAGPSNPFEDLMPQQVAGGKADRLDMQPMSAKQTADDWANSFGSGVTRGALDLVGLPGTVREFAAKGMGNLLGPTAETATRGAFYSIPGFQGPTGDQITPESVKYDPKTTVGRYAETAGEMLPNAVAPGGPVRKAAMWLLPSLGSEAAGQATEGTAIEPYARIGAALLGGKVAAGGKAKSAVDMVAANAKMPAEEMFSAVDTEKRSIYKALENAGVKYDANEFQYFGGKLAQDIGKKLDETLTPNATAVFKKIISSVGQSSSPTFADLETLRKNAGHAADLAISQGNKADAAFANSIRSSLDKFAEHAPLITNGSVDAAQVAPLAKRARDLASRTIKAEELATMRENAKGYLSGEESGIRNQMARVLKTPSGRHGWSKEELAGVKDATQGTLARNVIGSVGRGGIGKDARQFLGPSVTGSVGAALGSVFGPAGAMAGSLGSVAAATGARKLASKLTDKSVERLVKAVLSGRGAQKAAASLSASKKQDRIARLLLTGESGRAAGHE